MVDLITSENKPCRCVDYNDGLVLIDRLLGQFLQCQDPLTCMCLKKSISSVRRKLNVFFIFLFFIAYAVVKSTYKHLSNVIEPISYDVCGAQVSSQTVFNGHVGIN